MNDKDQYEFGVTVGMSLNLAVQRQATLDELLDKTLEIFKIALAAKSDPRFIQAYKEYKEGKAPAVRIVN